MLKITNKNVLLKLLKIFDTLGGVPFCWIYSCPSAQSANVPKGVFYFTLPHLKPIPLPYALEVDKHVTTAYWLMIRALYKHPVILKFSYRSLSAQLNVSEGCLHKHMRKMISWGWCSIKNGNLIFKGINKLKTTRNNNGNKIVYCCILIKVGTKQETILELRNAVIRNNIRKQEKQIARKVKIVNNCKQEFKKVAKPQIREINAAGGVDTFSNSILRYTTLSNKSLGSLLNRSKSTGQSVVKKLKQQGLIFTTKRFKVIKKNVHPAEFDHFRSFNLERGVFYHQGCIVQQLSNEIGVRQYKQQDAKEGIKKMNTWI